ncbi:DotU family type IV/VI secretion system protein [Novispirillum itersonii]|uniref:DotU family type IV/VI secretion system protein n=1 Tax=Novispirillum itersonii TaxID=189 RepID=UPI000375CDC2|nr:DotU family type IV/VI secretion system protein [Novispirillum itersonii]
MTAAVAAGGAGGRLYAFFVRFQQEVREALYQARRQPDGAPEASSGGGDVIRAMVATIQTRLLDLIVQEAEEVSRTAGVAGSEQFHKAAYAMVALTDELFLFGPPWPGRAVWELDLLELRYCGTARAGEMLPRMMEDLLKRGDRQQAELAAVYLLVLTAGFQGCYRADVAFGDQAARAGQARLTALTEALARRAAPDMTVQRIAGQSYSHTLDRGVIRRLPAVSQWVWACLLAVLVYLLVSTAVWQWLTADVRAILTPGG